MMAKNRIFNICSSPDSLKRNKQYGETNEQSRSVCLPRNQLSDTYEVRATRVALFKAFWSSLFLPEPLGSMASRLT